MYFLFYVQGSCLENCTKWKNDKEVDLSLKMFHFFPWKIFIADQSLELVSGHKSAFSPDCQLFWIKHLSLLQTLAPQLLAFEWGATEPELGTKEVGTLELKKLRSRRSLVSSVSEKVRKNLPLFFSSCFSQ